MSAPPISFLYQMLRSQICTTIPKPSASFEGRTVIVTGGNSGLGLETARSIVSLGADKVIITSRSFDRGKAAAKDIIATTGRNPSIVEVWTLDLCSFDSVRALGKRIKDELPRLDALICNAGIFTRVFSLTQDHETCISVNVIATFLLALMVLPKLKETAVATHTKTHLVVVSSDAHWFTDFGEEGSIPTGQLFAPGTGLNDERTARMGTRYELSKLLDLLVVRELGHDPLLAGRADYPVIITAPNPGWCESDLRREFYEGPRLTACTIKAMDLVLQRSSEEGSRVFVTSASAGEDFHGQYISDGKVADPSYFVRSEKGKRVQSRVWKELKDELERIEPGITENV